MATLNSAADRLEAAASAFVGLAPEVVAASPWPLAEVYGVEAEASWGPPEILAHIDEALRYWQGEMERVLDGGGEPVPFGRVAADPIRIGIIGRDRTLPPRELFGRVTADAARLAARMRSLTAAEAGRVGSHPRLGEMTVAELLDRFTVTHLEEHVAQLREQLAARRA